jgi:xylulokinase
VCGNKYEKMDTRKFFLGIDISTTGSKALLIDQKGLVLALASTPHTLQSQRPLWSEQDPQEWWQAACKSIQAVINRSGVQAKNVNAIGLTGQMHGLVLLDGSGKILRHAILWNDQRPQA